MKAPILSLLPDDVQLLDDCQGVAGEILEIQKPVGGMCIVLIDLQPPRLVGVPQEHEPELRALEGKRAGITKADGIHYVRNVEGVCCQ
jgi:hypothetical protein